MRVRARFVLLASVWTSPVALCAQEWQATAHTGRIRSTLDPAAASASVAVGLRYDDPFAGLRLSAGVPTRSADAFWGTAGAWKRLSTRFGGVRAGVDVTGTAFLTMDRSSQSAPIPGPLDPPALPDAKRDGHALAGQVLPLLGYERQQWQVHARAGVSRYAARLGTHQTNRLVRLADAQVTLSPVSSLAVMPAVRRYEANGEEPSTWIGASAVAASPRASLWGSMGQWSTGAGNGLPWSAGGQLRLHPLVAIDVNARHETFDPLFLQPAQTSWSVGLFVALSRRAPIAAPIPSAYVNGRATITLPLSASRTPPSIAGDFNKWTPAPMRRRDRHWTYTVTLAPGVYHYAFVSASGEWFVPTSVPGRKDDGMGGHVAVLVVK